MTKKRGRATKRLSGMFTSYIMMVKIMMGDPLPETMTICSETATAFVQLFMKLGLSLYDDFFSAFRETNIHDIMDVFYQQNRKMFGGTDGLKKAMENIIPFLLEMGVLIPTGVEEYKVYIVHICKYRIGGGKYRTTKIKTRTTYTWVSSGYDSFCALLSCYDAIITIHLSNRQSPETELTKLAQFMQ